MKKLAEGLYQLGGFPPNAINVYLAGDVLIDAGVVWDRRRILRQLRGQTVTAHALTHAHSDHQGASHAVCETLGIPLWCGAADVAAAEDPAVMLAAMPRHLINRLFAARVHGPGHPVSRALNEGDLVGEFRVIHTPGHTMGHVSYWREQDRVLILGDVLANMNFLTGLPKLREPPWYFSANPALNRATARKLAPLKPALVCFGHGPPLRDTRKFLDFLARLPE